MQLRQVTKQMMGAAVTASALLEIPEVSRPLLQAAAKHPHLSVLLGAAVTMASLLHNPRVIEALGIRQTSTEVVPVETPETPPQA